MSRLGTILDSNFSSEQNENNRVDKRIVCHLSTMRVLTPYYEWSEPIYGVDKQLFTQVVLSSAFAESAEELLEQSVVINDGKIVAQMAGIHESTGLVIPRFTDVETSESVDFDAIETISLNEAYFTSQIYDSQFCQKNAHTAMLLKLLFNQIEKLAGVLELESPENSRILIKFCEE